MILRFLPHSPYVRKVLVAARELGVIDRIEIVEAHVFDPETPLLDENPMGKVPALIRDDGSVLYDSTVICEWLDGEDGRHVLFPAAGEARIQALRRNALGDGLGQAATWNIRERYRPENERSDSYMAYYERTIDRCLAALDAEAEAFAAAAGRFDIGDIAIACAISYLDFRYPERGWRERFPVLGNWVAGAFARPSMAATELGPYTGPLSP
jgi:glutathione S-transferase